MEIIGYIVTIVGAATVACWLINWFESMDARSRMRRKEDHERGD